MSNVRLHFYHAWTAARFGNFISVLRSEWEQRSSPRYGSVLQQTGRVTLQHILHRFPVQMQVYYVDAEVELAKSAYK